MTENGLGENRSSARGVGVSDAVLADLAPGGTLRVAINLANFLLVSARDAARDPVGVAPDLGRAIADRLGVPVRYVPFADPSQLAAAAGEGVWDIGLIGAEPARAQTIAFTPAYAEIEATYLVPGDSPLRRVAEVDRQGVRISVYGGSAYDLWLARHIGRAELVRSDSIEASFARFADGGLEALAGLRPRLLADQVRVPGSRVLEGAFTAVQQAVGTPRGRPVGAAFLSAFVEEALRTGLVADLIARHGVRGLSPAASSA